MATLLASNRDPDAVMQTLDLHYGNKHVLGQRVAEELYDLPRLDSRIINLIQFAARLRNAIATFKTHGLTGSLFIPELIRAVGNKLPDALEFALIFIIFRYNESLNSLIVDGGFVKMERSMEFYSINLCFWTR